jgi:uncharacterized protein
MCCDGTLFDNVHLGPEDGAKRLRALGLRVQVSRAKSPITHFRQPCTALCADRTCRIYPDQPKQCRDFECGVFKAARTGQIKAVSAQRQVKQARQRADEIRCLLRELGDTDEHRPMAERFRRTQTRLETGGGNDASGATFAALGLAVHHFNLLAHAKFYTRVEVP